MERDTLGRRATHCRHQLARQSRCRKRISKVALFHLSALNQSPPNQNSNSLTAKGFGVSSLKHVHSKTVLLAARERSDSGFSGDRSHHCQLRSSYYQRYLSGTPGRRNGQNHMVTTPQSPEWRWGLEGDTTFGILNAPVPSERTRQLE